MGRDLPAIVVPLTTAVVVAIPVISVPVAVAVVPSTDLPAIRSCVVAVPVVVGIGCVILIAVRVSVTIAVVAAVVAVTISVTTMIVSQTKLAVLARVECCRSNYVPSIIDCVWSLCR